MYRLERLSGFEYRRAGLNRRESNGRKEEKQVCGQKLPKWKDLGFHPSGERVVFLLFLDVACIETH